MSEEQIALTDALEQTAEVTPEPEAQAGYLDNLVGEGKKYKSQEDLAKSYHHASLHIEELKSELEDARTGKNLMQEVLDELRKDAPETVEAPTTSVPAEPSIDTDDIAKIVDARLSEKTAAEKAKANVSASMKALSEVYGGQGEALQAVNRAIGGDDNIKKVIDDLSKSNPDAVVKFVSGVVPKGSTISNTPGVTTGVSADTIASSDGGLTWSECRDVKKNDPTRYNSREFRSQMEQAVANAESRGIDFFAT